MQINLALHSVQFLITAIIISLFSVFETHWPLTERTDKHSIPGNNLPLMNYNDKQPPLYHGGNIDQNNFAYASHLR